MARRLVDGGTLYVVATPLGNLGDVTVRAADILRSVATVAAEDTRRTRVLLSHLGAHPRLVSMHAHTAASRVARLARDVADGQAVALVSDAGTPTISDPGAALVNEVRAAGGAVVTVPGPSAVAAASSISGFPADRYIFLGFLPRKGAERRRLIDQIAQSMWTVVVFESPERLGSLLETLIQACGGDRAAAVARELTKVHEEMRIGTLSELEVYYRERPARGEVTVLVRGGDPVVVVPSRDDAATNAGLWLSQGMSRRDVVTRLVSELGLSRNEAYRMVTAL